MDSIFIIGVKPAKIFFWGNFFSVFVKFMVIFSYINPFTKKYPLYFNLRSYKNKRLSNIRPFEEKNYVWNYIFLFLYTKNRRIYIRNMNKGIYHKFEWFLIHVY